jgi:hypothetical protein
MATEASTVTEPTRMETNLLDLKNDLALKTVVMTPVPIQAWQMVLRQAPGLTIIPQIFPCLPLIVWSQTS